ncbi:DUF2497 domain-containing protein [Parvularcula marina]|uniref:DUF2497 domain-containing protein n=2 Tax=Parvularcula marina TaxID=2292771 RepID=A0A371RGZ6_9PROT|nr:DUF2497 domain-containing protein [Parvularcula marina]
MANPQSEPTMDEILASIRRIISEEDEAPEAKSPPSLEPLTLDESSSVSIDDDMIGGAKVEAGTPEPQDDPAPVEVAAPEPTVTPEPVSQSADPLDELAETAKPKAPVEQPKNTIDFDAISDRAAKAATESLAAQTLVSDGAAKKVSDAFGALHENVRVSNAGGQTIEDIVEAMLRPMIQQWLDQNLPRIVEEKVEEEVRRIARRR